MSMLNIPVPKAGAGHGMEIDTDDIMALPDDVLKEILLQGAKVVLNRGQSKLKSAKGMEGNKLASHQKAIMEVVAEQWEKMKKGEIRVTGGRSKVSGAAKTEALRLAKALVKDAIKKNGGKVSHYKASQITAAAKTYLEGEHGARLMKIAQANLAEQEKEKQETTGLIDLSGISPDEELVAKNPAKPKKGKGQEAHT